MTRASSDGAGSRRLDAEHPGNRYEQRLEILCGGFELLGVFAVEGHHVDLLTRLFAL